MSLYSSNLLRQRSREAVAKSSGQSKDGSAGKMKVAHPKEGGREGHSPQPDKTPGREGPGGSGSHQT